MIERKEHPVKCSHVNEGHLMAFVYWAKVAHRDGYGYNLKVNGIVKGTPAEFGVHGQELVEAAYSADQHHEEVKVSKTEAAQILTGSWNVPLTVCFNKQDGSERILRGRFVGEEPYLGYSHVEDLDQPEGKRLREVNHREINWLVVRGVKYIVGKKK